MYLKVRKTLIFAEICVIHKLSVKIQGRFAFPGMGEFMDRDNKIIHIEKVTDNAFLNFYDLTVHDRKGGEFHYYVASRAKNGEPEFVTRENHADGIMIYAVCKEDPGKIVLVKQYRYPLNDFVYEMPAGLVEKGEPAEVTAVREFHEETGMELEVYHGGESGLRNAFYTTVGMTDESCGILYGFACGTPSGKFREASEEMEVIFADRQEVKRILREEKVAMMCAQSLVHFLHADDAEPFAFLELE